ncbi:MAG: iron-sulfur cluster assembly scaffold protein [Armatimonadetes bacterium]|nr:iron-sulfur cluster assembly scaffold protein [Armatimonadota bacterium]
MYSDRVLALALDCRHFGRLEGPTHEGLVGIPGEGEFAFFSLRIVDGTVQEAAFETYTCPAAKASCELLCRVIEGKTLEKSKLISDNDLLLLIGGLPEGKGHLAGLAVSALRSCLRGVKTE